MSPVYGWIIAAAALVGHYGLHLAIYNRINGFGWPRRVIKTFVKAFFASAVLLPPIVVWTYWDVVFAPWLAGRTSTIPLELQCYGGACLASWFVFGIPWLVWRPLFALEWIVAPREIEIVDVQQAVSQRLALTGKCKLESRLPFNQLFQLSIEKIDLPVAGLPAALDGYRIAHLSDIHLTGDIHPDFTKYATARATQWQPDMMALTGDIIDKQPCIDWLVDIFSGARATDGCYFVLGNHDTRIVDSWQTREAMDRAGWTDLGSRQLAISLRGVPSLVIGNEHPWFKRPELDHSQRADFRLLLSHSPDQLSWARRNQVTLMLAGHTHGRPRPASPGRADS